MPAFVEKQLTNLSREKPHRIACYAPDIYMQKIAVGGGLPDDLIDLDAPVSENLQNLARAKKRDVGDLVVCNDA